MKIPVASRTAAVVALTLLLAPLPTVQAAPAARRVPRVEKIILSAWLPALRDLLVRAWSGEGMSIDPDGKPAVPVIPTVSVPGEDGLDEGVSIDPNGGH